VYKRLIVLTRKDSQPTQLIGVPESMPDLPIELPTH
jgi:hypothetical protein